MKQSERVYVLIPFGEHLDFMKQSRRKVLKEKKLMMLVGVTRVEPCLKLFIHFQHEMISRAHTYIMMTSISIQLFRRISLPSIH